MLPPNFTAPVGTRQGIFALAALALMLAAIGIALGFQHLAGFMPCAMCLEQRTPYYASIPLVGLGLLLNARISPAFLVRACFAIAAALMAYNMAFGIYHAGFEWGLWAGPTDCTIVSGGTAVAAGDLLAAIDQVKPPSCDQAAGRFLGLSFAGWNVVASAMISGLAGLAAFTRD